MLKEAAKSKALQETLREECRADLYFYINAFVWQHNPLKSGAALTGPFVLRPHQEKVAAWILSHIQGGKDGLIEKGREEGATWLNLIILDWLARFFELQTFICVSHMEGMVNDRHNPGSLFWKLGFLDSRLPDWFPHVTITKTAVRYPATESFVTGYATTTRTGVGARATAIFLDEFAKQADAKEIWGQTADTSRCRLVNSSHYGVGTFFNELSRRPGLDKIVMHWSHNPEKNRGMYRTENGTPAPLDGTFRYPDGYYWNLSGEPAGGYRPGLRSIWYDAECIRRGDDREVALHLDINPSGADSQFFPPLKIAQLKRDYAMPPVWEGEVTFERATGKFTGLRFKKGGKLRLWRLPDHQGAMTLGYYGIGADISTGAGASPSCLAIYDAVTGEEVGEYTDADASPDDLAPVAVALCWLWKTPDNEGARLMWEKAGPGVRFGKKVLELNYRNIYYQQQEMKQRTPTTSTVPGWFPSPDNKRVLLEEFKDGLKKGMILPRSEAMLDETAAFRYSASDGHVEHAGQVTEKDPTKAKVNHGDHVIASALAWHRCRSFGTIGITKKAPELPSVFSLLGRQRLRQKQRDREEYDGDEELPPVVVMMDVEGRAVS